MIEEYYKQCQKDGDCIVSNKVRSSDGYAIIYIPTPECKTKIAHRYIYQKLTGLEISDYVLDHLCRKRSCINIEHLEPVSIAENVMRGIGPCAVNSKKEYCKNGHPLFGENLFEFNYPSSKGRKCITCRRTNDRRYYHRKINRKVELVNGRL